MPGKESDWEVLLTGASKKAMEAVARAAAGGERARHVGVGASGDKTLVADRDAEQAIISELSKVPAVRILSEEAGEVGDRQSDTAAVVDPLDGSANFARGIPFYCTSIAVVRGRRLDQVSAALVRNLVNGDVYYAEKGRGAAKNGARIATSRTEKLPEAVAAVDLSRGGAEVVRRLAPLISRVRRQVHFGANALELCMLAEGLTDTFVDIRGSMRIVDFAAGYLIAEEAGAVVTSPDGERLALPLDLAARFSYVASANPAMHKEVLSALSVK